MNQWLLETLSALENTRVEPVDPSVLARLGAPPSYCELIRRVGAQEITPDFWLLSTARIELENLKRNPMPTGWFLFALTGAGDAWLVRTKGSSNETAFLDHDDEVDAKPTPLAIDFLGWLQVARYMRTHEEKIAGTRGPADRLVAVAAAKTFLDVLSAGLSTRFPFALD